MDEVKIIVALISGLFALLGGFLGAWLTRRTEYMKWIRQQRSLEFTEFIKQLEDFRSKANDIVYNHDLSDGEKDKTITELSIGLKPQENIVRLYLNKTDREHFSKLKHDIWKCYYPKIDISVRMKKHKEYLNAIQSLFEKNILG
ncbi:hypothetical protein [Desulfoluna butyratoxydans]|uniref:hypothetical protein n=1 Tax=Desulfoluna butyratoxydans TaxID=231438 RepID=UPI0015D2B5EC|nr:hypothetical protein [Desulfoluna butyratoxydans]